MSSHSRLSYWEIHRRIYNWVTAFAHHKHASLILFLISIAESSFFPLAPDILQIPMTLERRERCWFYATITLVGSVLGGIIGYFIGKLTWYFTSSFFLTHVFNPKLFEEVEKLYQAWGFWAVFVAAFTPIPYKVFTIAAGVFDVPFFEFVLASIIGRGARFFLVAALLHHYGARIKHGIEKYFNLLTIVFVVLLLGGYLLLKMTTRNS